MRMLDEIHYRVVRGILGANGQTHVQQVEINIDDLQAPTPSTSESHPLLRNSPGSE